MSIETDYRIALGVPAALMAAPTVAYFGGILVGIDRELALDSATVAIAIAGLAILNGLRQAPQKSWSLQLGCLLAVLISVGALALRAISLASSRGPLFYFTLASSAGLAYVAHRIVRGMVRSGFTGADQGTRASE